MLFNCVSLCVQTLSFSQKTIYDLKIFDENIWTIRKWKWEILHLLLSFNHPVIIMWWKKNFWKYFFYSQGIRVIAAAGSKVDPHQASTLPLPLKYIVWEWGWGRFPSVTMYLMVTLPLTLSVFKALSCTEVKRSPNASVFKTKTFLQFWRRRKDIVFCSKLQKWIVFGCSME